jgi:Fe-S-cluster-containing dehydrogenase component
MQIIQDHTFCTGCRACQQACQDRFNLPAKTKIMTIVETEKCTDGIVDVSYDMQVCLQCKRAACMAECMEGAVSRNAQGVVVVDENLCIGCGRCVEACPVAAIRLKQTRNGKKAIKCEVCKVCIEACPFGCISVAD